MIAIGLIDLQLLASEAGAAERFLSQVIVSPLQRYRLAYYLRSTALTMPILPIWWNEQPGVGVAVFLGGMAIQGAVSLAIDFPLSLWSDKTQPRIPYATGLGLFALAFLAALFGGFYGFIAYLVLICLAGALMSGSDLALLMNLARDNFKAELYELNRRFYLYTSGLFFLGVCLYLVSPFLLFGAQSLLLASACLLIATIDTADRNQSDRGDRPPNEAIEATWKISPTPLWCLVVAAISLAGGEFEAVNQLLNRSLQIVVAEASIPGLNDLWSVAGVLVITNLLSSLGLGTRARQLSERSGLRFTLIALTVGTLASLIFINSGYLFFILVGAVLMGVLKGVYRPLFATLAAQTMPASHWKARWLSITGMLSGLVSSVVNVLIVVGEPTTPEIMWRMTIQMLLVLGPAIVIIGVGLRLAVPLAHGDSSNKITRRVMYLGDSDPAFLEQIYPPPSHQVISTVVGAQLASGLPHPRILRRNDRQIEFEFINGAMLESINPSDRWQFLDQYEVFTALQHRKSRHVESLGSVAHTHFAQECQRICSCPAVSHGDLHPGNILLTHNRFVLVDWDQSGNSSRALDELALLTHPDLGIGHKQRAEVFNNLLKTHHSNCSIHALSYEQAAKRVLAAKMIDIRSREDTETKRHLLLAYKKIQDSL
ncbi:MFS transporter [Corynebacterium hindlerae]|uniref:MFS transporter n=1 Tax=Corynebacterium hindlerae TaxID=699041 RepID=UPI003AAD5AA2